MLRKTTSSLGCPRGVMVKAMNCGIVVREFVLQSRYYVHFRANTLGKGMKGTIISTFQSFSPILDWKQFEVE